MMVADFDRISEFSELGFFHYSLLTIHYSINITLVAFGFFEGF